jgi:hypothetical protein
MIEGTKIFEIIMLLCFGFAWPLSIAKSWKAGTNKGKSLFFLLVLLLGYVAGIINKIINHVDYVMFFYILNFLMVGTDVLIYFRNAKLDKKNAVNL